MGNKSIINKKTNNVEQLHLLRHRAVAELRLKRIAQQQLCQRLTNNIQALTVLVGTLAEQQSGTPVLYPAMLANQVSYKRNLESLIAGQQQQRQLANSQMRQLDQRLLQAAKQQKSLELILAIHQRQQRREEQRSEQKRADESTVLAVFTTGPASYFS